MKLRRLSFMLCCLVALVGLPLAPLTTQTKTVQAAQEDAAQGSVNFDRLVFIGDSLTAGYQSGAIFQTGQDNGYSADIIKQTKAKVTFPVISNPGLAPNSQFTLSKPICQSAFPVGFLNITTIQGAGTRLNPQEQATNLAIPGHTVGDLLTLKPKPITASANLTDVMLGLPGLLANPPIARSQMEWAEALKPTTLVVWIGNNDALGAVIAGSDKVLTPLADFTTRYTELMRRAKATGATNIFVANIPDVTSIAFLLSQDDVVKISGQNKETIQFIFGVTKKDFVLPNGLPLLPKGQKLPDSVVLTKKELKNIKKAVEDYNKVIAAQAAANGATLVDMNKLFTGIAQNGVTIDGVGKLNTRPFGGLFSLDFVHPSNTGYAIAANEFIKGFNSKGANVPAVDLKAVASADPLVCKPSGAADDIQIYFGKQDLTQMAATFERTMKILTDPNYPILTDQNQK
ncbi:MAG: hypothetical protein K1Y36_18755 [Blastocatellia bacterium]|nr:hypothetical protein [Blastocatellia bacterium]